tara:strand:+ start:3886 stop:4659 length:774 start_codon:yes stop_codon:yes gene_type:complete
MYVKINPPGTFCSCEALRDALKVTGGKTFLEVGCGSGVFSKFLCDQGLRGVGVDFSPSAIEMAHKTLSREIETGQYQLIEGDVFDLPEDFEKVDVALSYMVMEHVEDEAAFIGTIRRYVRPGGYVILAVPGRRDHWSLEDETVGHLRRYDREDLHSVMAAAHLEKVEVWSVAVPVSNILFHVGNWLLSRSQEMQKIGQSQREQTETSGLQEIPWKTVFPSWVKLILNRVTLWPLFVVQRMFYKTGLGVTMMGFGRVS